MNQKAPFYRNNMNEKCNAVLTLKLETILNDDLVNEITVKNEWEKYKHSIISDCIFNKKTYS